ncbi:MAG: hypothetical protein ACRD6N_10360, partial [Pyrinomonadaceae bacterium]
MKDPSCLAHHCSYNDAPAARGGRGQRGGRRDARAAAQRGRPPLGRDTDGAGGGRTPVRADRVQLQQVLMNLMLNGIEAMSGAGGELTIRTRRGEGEVVVSVSDT